MVLARAQIRLEMYKMRILAMSIFLAATLCQAQEVNWMSFEEAIKATKEEERKIIVDIFTEWCGWCKKMDQTTFQNKYIVDYINTHFYAVKFDGEQHDPIDFKGQTYTYVKNGLRGYHELAAELTRGRLSYPSVVFIDEELNVIQALRGFQPSLRFEQIMSYFAQDYHKTTPWSKYSENYHHVATKN